MYYNIELINEKTKETILYEDVQDLNEGEKMYFNFQINAQELKDGEYKLNVIDGDGNVVATDTLNVGEFDIVGIQHKRGENVYINTVLNAKTEANDVEIREINSIVFPSGDADAMTSVFVRARPVFNDGYTEGYDNGHTDGYNSGHTDGFAEGKTEGYNEGKTDGIAEGIESQKNKLTPISITENGTYSNENGYNEVTVNVQDTNGSYDEGYNDGIEEQKSKLTDITITENGSYSNDNGYKDIVVNVQDTNGSYDEGYNDGIEEQKSKLTDITITENGSYSNDNGYKDIVVNVQDTNGSYDEGYNDGIANAETAIAENAQVLDITANGKYATKYSGGDGNLIKEVNVSVPKGGGGCVDFEQIGYDENDVTKFNADIAYSKTIYDSWNPERTSARDYFNDNTELVYCPKIDTSKVTGMERMFYACSSLTSIPQLDTSKVTNMRYMFYNCASLKTIPLLDTSNVTDMVYMFSICKSLTSIPQLVTSNVTNMSSMFYGCFKLESLPLLDTSNVTNINTIFGYSSIITLTDLGGFKNLKIDWNDNGGLYRLPNLTYQSIMNVINNLYDFRGNGDSTTTRTLQIHSNAMAMLTDEDKALATGKGWTLTS